MIQRQARDADVQMLSEAVQEWYRFYEVPPDDVSSDALCSAALSYFHQGVGTAKGIASALIGSYVGIHWTRVNAPASCSIH